MQDVHGPAPLLQLPQRGSTYQRGQLFCTEQLDNDLKLPYADTMKVVSREIML
jgi:hypothetical protein